MNEKDIIALVENLVPYFIKKYKETSEYKRTAQIKCGEIAEITENSDGNLIAKIKFPFESQLVDIPIYTSETLSVGDNVFIMYWDSLTNGMVFKKNSGL